MPVSEIHTASTDNEPVESDKEARTTTLRPVRRFFSALVLALFAATAVAVPAQAHAELKSSNPASAATDDHREVRHHRGQGRLAHARLEGGVRRR